MQWGNYILLMKFRLPDQKQLQKYLTSELVLGIYSSIFKSRKCGTKIVDLSYIKFEVKEMSTLQLILELLSDNYEEEEALFIRSELNFRLSVF